jgi:putative addiction module component (TIGR02574 family)
VNAAQILEHVNKLPIEEQREIFERLRDRFQDDLTPEQRAELERRAEDALRHSDRGTRVESVAAKVRQRLLAGK